MNTFKKFAIRFAAVSAAFALAFSFMVSSPKEADGAALTVAVSGGVNNILTSTSIPASATLGTINNTGQTLIAAGGTLIVTLPTGFVVNTTNIVAADVTVQQAKANAGDTDGSVTACASISSDATNRTITCTLAAGSLSTGANVPGTGVMTVAFSATAAGN